jgi:glycosyltransferase involved in cell wall biosynthesis
MCYINKKTGYAVFNSNKEFNQRIGSLVSRINPIAILSHFGPAGIEMHESIKNLNIKHFCVIHGYDGSRLLRNNLYINQLKKSSGLNFIFASKSMMDNFHKAGVNCKGFVHHLGYDGARQPNQHRKLLCDKARRGEKIIFFQAANLVEKKGHQYSLEALYDFKSVYPDFEYWIAGSGPLLNELKKISKKLGVANNIRFLGHLNGADLQNAFDAADVFLHHSITAKDGDQESIPTVLMEAMYQQLPVISTIHSGIPELINHKINGLLVPEKNINSYVENLRLVLQDDGSMGRNAMETVKNKFSFSSQIDTLASIIAN